MTRWHVVACVAALVPLIVLVNGQRDPGKQGPKSGVVFTAEKDPSQKIVVNDSVSTIYTYSEKLGAKPSEVWRLKLNEEHIHHWIAPSGNVWVLTAASRRTFPGTGYGTLWVRDRTANLVGAWSFSSLSVDGSGTVKQPTLDLKATQVLNVERGGAEQIRLSFSDGSETRLSMVATGDAMRGERAFVIHKLPAGRTAETLLDDLLKKGPSPTLLDLTETAPVIAWRGINPFEPLVLQHVASKYFVEGVPSYTVREEEIIPQMPSEIVRTPSGRVLWFETKKDAWQKNSGLLRIMDRDGHFRPTVRLQDLKPFASPQEAESNLDLQHLMIKRGSRFVPLRDAERTPAELDEQIQISDYQGNRYVIVLKGDGEGLIASHERYTNPETVPAKEPQYPGASVDEKAYDSESGQFRARVRNFSRGQEQGVRLTVLAKVTTDPGKSKYVELGTQMIGSMPNSVLVTNSGRVWAYYEQPWTNPQTQKPERMMMLLAINPDGTQLTGLDLVQQRWFRSFAEARQASLDGTKIVYEGMRGQQMIDGIPVPTWPLEGLKLPFKNALHNELWVKTDPSFGMRMPMVFWKEPKKD